MSRLLSKRDEPSMTVLTISTISTMTPKNSENHRAARKTSDAGLRSLLLPVAIAVVTSRAVRVAIAISRPA